MVWKVLTNIFTILYLIPFCDFFLNDKNPVLNTIIMFCRVLRMISLPVTIFMEKTSVRLMGTLSSPFTLPVKTVVVILFSLFQSYLNCWSIKRRICPDSQGEEKGERSGRHGSRRRCQGQSCNFGGRYGGYLRHYLSCCWKVRPY